MYSIRKIPFFQTSELHECESDMNPVMRFKVNPICKMNWISS